MTRTRLSSLVASVLLAGCGGGTAAAPQQATPGESRTGSSIVVTEDDMRLPAGCRPGRVARLVSDAVDAGNRGHADRFRLAELIVGYANGLGQIEYKLTPPAEGKGAVDCEKGEIVVWTGARPRPVGAEQAVGPLCPRPDPPALDSAVACVRHWR
jgi:hypothetical protein